jgi:ABC-type glutathione transport system ATPase component
MQLSAEHERPLIVLRGVARYFDVSRPWLNRVIERAPRLLLKAVEDVSFEIRRGETLALVGESGCGKSTVARLIAGLYRVSRGQIEFDGQAQLPTASVWSPEVRRRMQMIFQDPYASLNPRWRVADIVADRYACTVCERGAVRSAIAQRPCSRRSASRLTTDASIRTNSPVDSDSASRSLARFLLSRSSWRAMSPRPRSTCRYRRRF